MPPQDSFTLGRLGILEIDQLVDSIEGLNKDANRNIARTEFFSRMSHDMRTPMNAIISFSSQELLENTSQAQKQEYFEKIHSSSEYLLGLINEVLDMTKIESNKIDIQCSALETSKLWDTILSMIDKLAQKKHINFVKDISMEDTVVMADEQHLNQIVMNLLSNAVKFTSPNGTVSLTVTTDTDFHDPQMLNCCVIIADSGAGMSEEFMKHLYEPFKQENDIKEGTGLGLSIAKKLIDLMGGTIECSSKKNKGTKFTLKFSLEKCTDKQILESIEKKKKEDKKVIKENEISVLAGKRILVCEDHPLNMQIITKILQRVGIEVVMAGNGKIGVDKFKESKENFFDVILLDIRMPVMDGLETTRTIRSLDRGDSAVIPIIAMIANAFFEDVNASKAAGMNEHLSKPIEAQKLYETLQRFVADRKRE